MFRQLNRELSWFLSYTINPYPTTLRGCAECDDSILEFIMGYFSVIGVEVNTNAFEMVEHFARSGHYFF